jgi:hypothetical protein
VVHWLHRLDDAHTVPADLVPLKGHVMKKVYIVLAALLCISIALAFGGTHAHAQSSTVQKPMFTSPYCYGDGLPHNNPPIQGCDGLLYQNTTNCPNQSTVQTKPIGSSDGEGQIGTLYLQYSSHTSGCNSWWAAVQIIHSGCFIVTGIGMIENNADSSPQGVSDVSLPRSVCQNQWVNTYMIGDWQPGGCYWANSNVLDSAGIHQMTSTSTYCY